MSDIRLTRAIVLRQSRQNEHNFDVSREPQSESEIHARRSLSTVGGTHWPINLPPLLFIHLHSPPLPRNGVRSHSRCGTES